MSIPSPTPAANPYASPAIAPAVAPPEEPPHELKIASQGKRLLNLILDNVVLFVVNQVVGFMVGVICGVYLGVTGQAVTPELQTQVNIASIFIGLAVALCYFIASEALLQRTLAKYLTGTMVVNEEGRRPTFGQIVGRSFTRFVPFEAFTFLGGERPVGLHDRWSGTHVIDLRR